jgi:hypothetical protein
MSVSIFRQILQEPFSLCMCLLAVTILSAHTNLSVIIIMNDEVEGIQNEPAVACLWHHVNTYMKRRRTIHYHANNSLSQQQYQNLKSQTFHLVCRFNYKGTYPVNRIPLGKGKTRKQEAVGTPSADSRRLLTGVYVDTPTSTERFCRKNGSLYRRILSSRLNLNSCFNCLQMDTY